MNVLLQQILTRAETEMTSVISGSPSAWTLKDWQVFASFLDSNGVEIDRIISEELYVTYNKGCVTDEMRTLRMATICKLAYGKVGSLSPSVFLAELVSAGLFTEE